MGGLGGQPPPFKNNFRNPANHHPDSRQRGTHASKWNQQVNRRVSPRLILLLEISANLYKWRVAITQSRVTSQLQFRSDWLLRRERSRSLVREGEKCLRGTPSSSKRLILQRRVPSHGVWLIMQEIQLIATRRRQEVVETSRAIVCLEIASVSTV